MKDIQLSNRLLTVANYIPPHSVLADIGSDHAYLPCYAILNYLAKKAIAGEINDGPYQAAFNQVARLGLLSKISVRKGDGLSVLKKNEATCITIAGMGGTLIKKILEEGKEKLSKVERLILQPNIYAIEIRKWLYENGWELIDEKILEEDCHIYEVLVAEKGVPSRSYKGVSLESAFLMGPFLIKERNETFLKKWEHELYHWEQVLKQLNEAKETDVLIKKKSEIHHMISCIREVMK
ncbi:tRNA (adenine(22)-N(1))-methyltransferase [Aeribacillus alveayuensis]|uniref:tRNA (Adenine22-N1)-methyltransferase n=1 Tax=Aeribacillus alveayuensis TaxID=279215 RepID=A0ABT9VKD9_9BACI|nr:tRNA (adenine22-N1)-methyltransferase [Bacillus alveayuensis]